MKPVIITIAAAALFVSGTIIWKDGQDAARLEQREQAALKATEEAKEREAMAKEVARQFAEKKEREDARRKEWQDRAEHLKTLMLMRLEHANATGKQEDREKYLEAKEQFDKHVKVTG